MKNGATKQVSLGQVGEFRAGFGFPRTLQGRTSGDYPFAKVGDISRVARTGARKISAAGHYVDEADLPTLKAKPVPAGTIVFAKIGEAISQNFRAITTCEMLIDNNTMGFVPDTKVVDRQYLFHFMNQLDLYPLTGATTVPALRKSTLEAIKIPLPPLPEQKRIADILDKADTVLRKRQEAGSLIQEVPLAAFRETFAEFLDPKQTETVLSDTAEVVSGVAKGRKLNGEEIREVPYLRVANVQAGFLDLTEIKTIPAKQSEVDALALQHGDAVLTEGGDHDKLGRGALWEHDVPDCIHQNHVFRVRVDRKRLLPTFFVHFLQTEIAKAYFLRCAKKTTNLASINMTQLRALPVPLPPMKLQKRFDQEFRSVTNVIDRQAQAERKADELFNALVQRAFMGRL